MCTHTAASQLLAENRYLDALGVAGPLLEANPRDITAWQLVTRALAGLGEKNTALPHLVALAETTAKRGYPILALSIIKEAEALGADGDKQFRELASLYGKDSTKLKEVELLPPPLPEASSVQPWDPGEPEEKRINQAKEVASMAWGEALTAEEKQHDLPFIPILSALSQNDFVLLAKALERIEFKEEETVIQQGEIDNGLYLIAEGSVAIIRQLERGEKKELARLGSGTFFGEMSLVTSAPRAAEVRTRERTVLLKAGKEEIENLVERAPRIADVLVAFCHARMLENLMRISPVLTPVPATKRPDVIAMFNTDYYGSGEVVIREGAPGKGLYLIVSGEAHVQKKEGLEKVLLSRLGPGDVFGEISLLMQRRSTATVTATEDLALLFLASNDFMEVTKEFPELLKGAFDIALEREAANNSIIARETTAADDLVLL
jgi:cAMP-dependent protein kinase regulator